MIFDNIFPSANPILKLVIVINSGLVLDRLFTIAVITFSASLNQPETFKNLICSSTSGCSYITFNNA